MSIFNDDSTEKRIRWLEERHFDNQIFLRKLLKKFGLRVVECGCHEFGGHCNEVIIEKISRKKKR